MVLEYSLRQVVNTSHQSSGIQIVKERVKWLIGRKRRFIKIIDLGQIDTQQSGTRIEILFPTKLKQ